LTLDSQIYFVPNWFTVLIWYTAKTKIYVFVLNQKISNRTNYVKQPHVKHLFVLPSNYWIFYSFYHNSFNILILEQTFVLAHLMVYGIIIAHAPQKNNKTPPLCLKVNNIVQEEISFYKQKNYQGLLSMPHMLLKIRNLHL
jgi:hypothetical protein